MESLSVIDIPNLINEDNAEMTIEHPKLSVKIITGERGEKSAWIVNIIFSVQFNSMDTNIYVYNLCILADIDDIFVGTIMLYQRFRKWQVTWVSSTILRVPAFLVIHEKVIRYEYREHFKNMNDFT